MNLFDKVSEDIKDAMRAKDKVKLEALRGMKKEFIEAKTAKGANDELSDEAAIQILQKMAKQRRDSAEIYTGQNRPDLAEKELAELAVIETYLPKQLSQDELDVKIADIIAQVGASSPADMGKVMGVATKALAGLAAGKAISETVKKLLSK
ncbi:GatB/YqeY domain-containing protein [Dysgonomonas sp. Marseille-P4677]|uniref:GatB/YqeY domain-containing protein n=1 Tax=Dysgonomonas sp. Marseille-P4677 TaxID=2364790 RepID=UPI0019130FBC|nr:GatB/YqeY domain-containing protein [Dysgonomonas sp. Marseille-P4677]MBK5719633.1 GatB/YqeY domain-containing protein [Dysgonomonas sp. Marseille-P4677]